MCDTAVEVCLVALKFASDWFVTSTIIKKLYTTLYTDENKLYFDENFDNIKFNCNEMVFIIKIVISLTLTTIVLTKMILILLFMSDFCLGILNLKNAKDLKNNKMNN